MNGRQSTWRHGRKQRQDAVGERKARALSEWRGVDLRGEEEAMRSSTRLAGEIMPAVVRDLGLDKKQSQLEVLKVWNKLVDPTVVAHAQPTGLNKGTLFVTVDSSVWLSEIVRYRKKEILKRLQHSFGSDYIAKISFRLG